MVDKETLYDRARRVSKNGTPGKYETEFAKEVLELRRKNIELKRMLDETKKSPVRTHKTHNKNYS